MPHVYVGIDLGGTAIKLALVSVEGQILYQTTSPTDVKGGGDDILKRMVRLMEEGLAQLSLTKEAVLGIGIGAPGFMDLETGFVYEAVNLGWRDYPLKEKLTALTGMPVFVDNDANIAALGEMWRGSGAGAKDLLCVTLGTGVGGGVILNGDIYHGARGTAGEIGHITVVTDKEKAFRCNCGKKGCLETMASATGIVRLAMEALTDQEHQEEAKGSQLAALFREKGTIEAKDLFEAAKEQDALSIRIVEQVGYYLGLALGNYAIILNPEKIVIGGGVSKAGDILFDPIREQYRQFALPHLTGEVEIIPASLGNDAGVIGAAWLVHIAQ